MGLVDYSESDDSGSEAGPQPPPASTAASKTTQKPSTTSKKPFQKVVDRSNPGKIVVNLGQAGSSATSSDNADQPPPAKRARTAGGGRFSGFNSFLPPPKNPNAKPSGGASGSFSGAQGKPKPGVNLRTSAAPGFSRDENEGGDDSTVGATSEDAMGLPPPKKQQLAEPSIPEGQLAAEDVKITGKPMMFKPLSVSRKPAKKKTPKADPIQPAPAKPSVDDKLATAEPAPPPKKTSLFSVHVEEPSEPEPSGPQTSAYEPYFSATDYSGANAESDVTGDYNSYVPPESVANATTAAPESLDNVIDGMNLSAAARRELFGREGAPKAGLAASRVVNFNMDTEYQHNEDLRAAGEQQIHNPVRAIQGGKHNLRQLVRNVQDQKEALEDSFAKGRTNRKEASSKYGW
ncbi:mitotic checkpoint regulator, MAD2B-interacting domain-containing protein [Sarocladium implicatum]|nr:mitotic checkpoint regulator, MAD2B-interacting domain-containing protein [Sarocladium implicatum]